MNKKNSLEEDARHGTQERPLAAMHFTSGPGTLYPEHFFVQRHWHHNIEILKVIRGSYTVELNLENDTLKEGDLCFINSGELHQISGDEKDTVHEVLIFDPHILGFSYEDDFQRLFSAPLLERKSALPRKIEPGDPVYSEISALFDQAAETGLSRNEGWYFRAKLTLLELLNTLYLNHRLLPAEGSSSASEKERIDRYKRIISYMEEHYMDKVTLEMLAKEAQCNPQYLCHFFKEIAGESPVQFLIGFRVEKAKKLLQDTTKSVLELSLDTGFENVSYFIRQFKRYVGKTPGEYRRELLIPPRPPVSTPVRTSHP